MPLSLCAVPLHSKVRDYVFHSSSLPFPGPVFRGGTQAWGSDAHMQVSQVLASGSPVWEDRLGWAQAIGTPSSSSVLGSWGREEALGNPQTHQEGTPESGRTSYPSSVPWAGLSPFLHPGTI